MAKKAKALPKTTPVAFTLRMGLAVVFLYAGIGALLNPDAWIGFIPLWLARIVPEMPFLYAHAITDALLGLWLVSGWKPYYAGLLAAAAMSAIIIFNLGALDIVFRDVTILSAAIALMLETKR